MVSDGRQTRVPQAWRLLPGSTTILDHVRPEMVIAREEVFGPVLNVMRLSALDEATDLANQSVYGNGAAIFTGRAMSPANSSIELKLEWLAMLAYRLPLAMFLFTGWDQSFFGDLHMQGREGVQFYTRQKAVTSRWLAGETSGRPANLTTGPTNRPGSLGTKSIVGVRSCRAGSLPNLSSVIWILGSLLPPRVCR